MNKNTELSTEEKLRSVQLSHELLSAMAMLTAAFEDCKLKSHITFTYQIEETKYKLSFMPVPNETSNLSDDVENSQSEPKIPVQFGDPGWDCPTSPTGHCDYKQEDGSVDEDCCRYCGEPEERK